MANPTVVAARISLTDAQVNALTLKLETTRARMAKVSGLVSKYEAKLAKLEAKRSALASKIG
jgi:outer membrane murein-binding lipoprotein Lpp